ncbi:MAG TPA: GNAT family N-acetyltransferase [Mycobacteriales bacterium]|jgi:predicted GNAT family N-acyltransferase|nr:GNAT family N-acetyltransferase [Mycobacteriales bacterium]
MGPEGLIVRPAGLDDLAGLHALRLEVFGAEQGVPVELIRDRHDDSAVQLVAVHGAELVGTGRLVQTGPTGLLGRIATRAGRRGQGIGAALLAGLERVGRDRGLVAVELHAQLSAYGFYERAGYVAVGEPFLEAGLKHVTMRKPLPVLRPAIDADSAALIDLIGGCFAEYPGCVLAVDAEEPWLRRPASAYAEAGGRLWAAELGGRVVACVGHKPHAGSASELKNLYVAAAARRGGLGGWLVGVVEAAARSAEATGIVLWSDTRFRDAHRLYTRLGYANTGRTRELHDLSVTVEYEFARDL